MGNSGISVVTGAFGYTGRYIARRLLDEGETVRTLTRTAPSASPFSDRIDRRPRNFDDISEVAESLRGAHTLYNTYWVRFARGYLNHELAVRNTRNLVDAAVSAGVQRIVHISITNADAASPLPYFQGKGLVEDYIRSSGLSYSIVRPTVIFGREDVLINNIAWFLRRFPVFLVAGSGDYPIQPVFVDDVARLAVESSRAADNVTLDAVSPEVFTFKELLNEVRRITGGRARLMHAPPSLAAAAARLMGLALRDVVLTRDEIDGLMAGHLVSSDPPTGETRLTDWLRENRQALGARYTSELSRNYR